MLDPEGSVEHQPSPSFPKVLLIPLAMLLAIAALLLLAFSASRQKEPDFYTFKVVNIRGKLVSLEKYRGSVSLVVNVASECGYTDSHYKALQQLQRDLGPYHFNVLAFPCNQFGQQEPDSNREIESFARKTYGASFPMFSKITVSGAGAIPAYKYLIGLFLQTSHMTLAKAEFPCGPSGSRRLLEAAFKQHNDKMVNLVGLAVS
ncbi:Glutathione peroxidase 7 [Willisornis vidua]|uniref:Glutathione peroxidase n=1 Tax=Willisornis vidua TaxID=1566151 RepID=A0ABQ9CT58_9PASS|nr:Glutathione peroxidase 7 [Willisornis vidua]